MVSRVAGNGGAEDPRLLAPKHALEIANYSLGTIGNGCTASGSRVAVITLNTRESSEFGEFSAFVNGVYTHKHGYDYIEERCVPDTVHLYGGDPMTKYNFAKAEILLEHLPHYEYLAYLDSDAYFHDFDQTIEAFVDSTLRTGADIIVGQDCMVHGACWNPTLNTGVLFVRRSAGALMVLREWAVAMREGGFCHPWDKMDHAEQGCLRILVNNVPEINATVHMLSSSSSPSERDVFTINSQVGSYVTHMVSCYGECRRGRLQFAMQRVLQEQFGMDLRDRTDQATECTTLLHISNSVLEMERGHLYHIPDGSRTIDTMRGAIHTLAELARCPGYTKRI